MQTTSHRAARPLSPHLQIYKPQLTSVLSILHRMSGAYLTLCVLGIISWVYGIAMGADCFYAVMNFWNSFFGKLIIFSWVICFSYHLSNGIRHLAWDVGWGFELTTAYRTGKVVIGLTLIFSSLAAIIIF